MSVLANFYPNEGTVNGTTTITFPIKVRYVLIVNKSSIRDLQFKFKSSETFATLDPTEELSVHHHVDEIFLSTTGNVSYKVWGFG